MGYTWDDVPVVRLEDVATGWAELDDSGWFAMVAWLAGPRDVARTADDRERTATVIVMQGSVETHRYTEPATAEDLAKLHEDIDSYLADAAIPPRPQGFRWFMRLPAGYVDGQRLQEDIGRRVYSRLPIAAPLPADYVPLIREALGELYP
jgi:hypothetical protein